MATGQCDTRPTGLRAYQTAATARRVAAVRHAVDELVRAGTPVSFRSVALKSGISKSTLYRNSQYRALVLQGGRACSRPGPTTEELMQHIGDLQSQIDHMRNAHMACQNVSYAVISFGALEKNPACDKLGRVGQ